MYFSLSIPNSYLFALSHPYFLLSRPQSPLIQSCLTSQTSISSFSLSSHKFPNFAVISYFHLPILISNFPFRNFTSDLFYCSLGQELYRKCIGPFRKFFRKSQWKCQQMLVEVLADVSIKNWWSAVSWLERFENFWISDKNILVVRLRKLRLYSSPPSPPCQAPHWRSRHWDEAVVGA